MVYVYIYVTFRHIKKYHINILMSRIRKITARDQHHYYNSPYNQITLPVVQLNSKSVILVAYSKFWNSLIQVFNLDALFYIFFTHPILSSLPCLLESHE